MNDINKFDLVLVYKLDRLTRNVRDLLDLLEIFEQNNVAFRVLLKSMILQRQWVGCSSR